MASCEFPDTYTWLQNLPSINQWKTDSLSISICSSSSSSSSSSPSLNLSVTKNNKSPFLTFSITADFNLSITLWTSKPLKINPNSPTPLDEETISNLLNNFIDVVLSYNSNKTRYFSIKIPKPNSITNLKDIFNLAFLTVSLLISIYEAPADLRAFCLEALKTHVTNCRARQASESLMKLLGSNLEEQWMRSVNLAITNWIMEVQSSSSSNNNRRGMMMIRTPSSLFSYGISTPGFWRVQLYCPVIAMDVEKWSNPGVDEKLLFSLNYHQLEGVLQFYYKIVVRERWIDVMINVDNIRCDVIRILNETLMRERGVGAEEKHFPSRISLQITPTLQTNILSVSVNKSSENPQREIEIEKSIEGGFDPPSSFFGFKVSAGETTITSMKPWKFEQSIYGYSGVFNWFLHDSMDGREVFSSKPSKISLINPKAWFKDRYSNVYRPFTRQGGVIFARDEYGERVCWKVDKKALGKSMDWEIRGWIWLTYWPNKHRTFYSETRRLEFREIVHLNIG